MNPIFAGLVFHITILGNMEYAELTPRLPWQDEVTLRPKA